MAKFFRSYFKLAINDLASQYAIPVKSLAGYVLTKRNAAKTDFINKAVVEALHIKKDDFVLEFGYGRGNAIGYSYQKIRGGNGMIFGVERSEYMEDVVRKKYILEIKEESKIRLDRAYDLRNLPYPSDIFNHVYHVDFFYFLDQMKLVETLSEIRRVIKPGGRFLCGISFERLKHLVNWGLVTESQSNPMRYLTSLEPSGFTDVKITYHDDASNGPYQLISATNPAVAEDYFDPEEQMRQLEETIKKEMLIGEMLKTGKKPTKEDFELLNEKS